MSFTCLNYNHETTFRPAHPDYFFIKKIIRGGRVRGKTCDPMWIYYVFILTKDLVIGTTSVKALFNYFDKPLFVSVRGVDTLIARILLKKKLNALY